MSSSSSTAPLRDTLLKLCRREDLTRDEAREAFAHIMSGDATEAQIGGLLVGLAAKGTTVEELVGAATVMREKAVRIDCSEEGSAGGRSDGATERRSDEGNGVQSAISNRQSAISSSLNPEPRTLNPSEVIIDTCGTGGDVRGTFNISTAAALIIAAAGVRVVKHGNRSASSKSGSADVLEKLGVKLELPPAGLKKCLEAAGICFAFARYHHPAMKFVAAARTSLGIPTIFNLLGPLTNPARARHQLLGVFAPELTDRLATVLRELGSERAWVVNAHDGLDELSTLGPTRVSELKVGHIHTWTLDPQTLGLPYARISDLQVESVDQAAEMLTRVIRGEKGPTRDIALLNAAAGLVISGQALELKDGLKLAGEAVDSGRAKTTLKKLVEASQGE